MFVFVSSSVVSAHLVNKNIRSELHFLFRPVHYEIQKEHTCHMNIFTISGMTYFVKVLSFYSFLIFGIDSAHFPYRIEGTIVS